MPQVQVVNTTRDKPDPTGVQEFFTRVGKDYKDKEDRVEIGNLISTYQKNREDSNAWEDLQLGLEKSTIGPTKRLETQKSLNEMKKLLIEKDKALNQQAKDAQPKPGEFEKTLQRKAAEKVSKLEDEIPKLQDSVKNMDTVLATAEKHLKGPTGYVKAWTNSQSAKEVENLSASNLDSVIKMFNPAGTLPTAKLNWIRETFAVKASDRIPTMKGKIKSLKILANQALERNKQKLSLLKKYKGEIPEEIEKIFDGETLKHNDAVSDQLAFKLKLDEVPEDGSVKNMYDLKGEKLGPIPKKEAIKLFEEGLITNEPR